ncbi:hypothetical protein ANN_00263 [Periplaneta americana]|uniref:MADF domain-containing protein n=1 Tax=Periplaneta americana TaxID=6978 RepID=A0ABQ8TQF7_PERAM|nr:hypothetical protein ANN_00263 [Periplaneta americana]
MDLREVGYDDRDWINLAQDRDRWRAYQEDRDMTYALFCSVLCIMEQVLFDEILILSVEENPHVYDKRRGSYKDEKMKENTWLSIAASLNTDHVDHSQISTLSSSILAADGTGIMAQINCRPERFCVGLVGSVGIALAFYARGCGFDSGPCRWHLSVLKCDRLMSVDLLASKRLLRDNTPAHRQR